MLQYKLTETALHTLALVPINSVRLPNYLRCMELHLQQLSEIKVRGESSSQKPATEVFQKKDKS